MPTHRRLFLRRWASSQVGANLNSRSNVPGNSNPRYPMQPSPQVFGSVIVGRRVGAKQFGADPLHVLKIPGTTLGEVRSEHRMVVG